ncbi:diamine N-acetyltransferase [Anaerolineae bacterium]|nr:diamine N-acetyltransferase [Anaerolineae bacterium]
MDTGLFSIRLATPSDAGTICMHRRAMFQDMRSTTPEQAQAGDAAFQRWLPDRLADDEYRAWFAMNARGEVVAGVGLWLIPWAPSPDDQSPLRGYVMNVYTRPECRRQGLARRLMNTLIEWCCQQNIRLVVLHASKDGRALYESLGFRQTNEMRLQLAEEGNE